MKILVTGATGFIGKNFIPEAETLGWQVNAAVRTIDKKLELPAKTEAYVIGDITPDNDWSAAVTGCYAVVHLAARVHMMNDTSANPLAEFRRVNTEGTANLARQAAAAGVKRFVFISSIKVNGEGRDAPYSTNDAAAPEDPYGLSKWEAEQALHEIAQKTGMEIVVLRIPLVYGPGVGANFLKLMRIIERGIPLPLGGIKNQRSLLFVGNLASAIIRCIEKPAASNQTYLVTDRKPVSTPDLIKQIAASLGKYSLLIPIPESWMLLAGSITGKMKQAKRLIGSLVIDSSKLSRDLDWQAPYSMQEGLNITAKWYLAKKRSA